MATNTATTPFPQPSDDEREGLRALEAGLREELCELAVDAPETLECFGDLGAVLSEQGKHAESEAVYRKELAGRRRTIGADAAETLRCLSNLGDALSEQEKHVEAEAVYREELAGRRRSTVGADASGTLACLHNLGSALHGQGKHAEAEAVSREKLWPEAARR